MIRYFIFCQGDILLSNEGNIPFGINPPVEIKPWNHVTTLTSGTDEIKVIRLDQPVKDNEHFQMMPLRKSFEVLLSADYEMAGKCAELVYWDQTYKYCGVCGSPLKWQNSISKKCHECGKEWWPSPAVAVIVRVERNDEILLVKSRNFRTDFYGLVAGFVETGESLEQAIAREVLEETHITIKNIRYFGSQPWPYPCGLMVGYIAEYVSGEIALQKAELSDGGWFTKDNLPKIPAKASIARELIDDWLNS